MNRIKSFREHSQEIVESQIRARIIQILHEGVRMVHTSSPLNESKYPELQRMLDKAEGEGKHLIIAEFVPEIEALVDKFGESGQSGGSAPFTAAAIVDTIKKMLAHEPLGDGIECTDEEWNDVSGPSDLKPTSFYQNNRLSSVFKEGKEGKPYYLDAIVFKPVGKDYTFTGSVSMTEGVEERIGSSQYIKSLPFTPKTFIIDVEEKEYRKNEDGTLVEEQGGGWWESWLADSSRLEEVFEYYDRKECHKG